MIFSLRFVLWLTLMKHQFVTLRQNIDTHRIFSTLFLITLRQTVFKWIISKLAVFTYFVCIWSFGRARSSKCTLLVSFRARRAGTHTHFSLGNSISCGFYIQCFIIKHVQQFSNCKDGILQQSTNDWSDSDVKFWSGMNKCAPLWREGSCARRNAAIILKSQKH